jgi:hypothetical protein
MGGKSRKSGGVSLKLIQALKASKGEKSKCINVPKNEKENRGKSLFDKSSGTED